MLPCRRFADVLADACARLGAMWVVLLHRSGLSPHTPCRSPAHSLELRPAHSRRHLYVTSYTEGFSHFVTSMTAPVASGWSVRRVGLCTHWKAPPCHGARRVEMWRGDVRLSMSVSAPFVWRRLSGSTVAPFPHPAHRTGRADLSGSSAIAGFRPQSGRIEARTGLRMMPTFPQSPLTFRTAGFPHMVRLACQAMPSRIVCLLKPAPGVH